MLSGSSDHFSGVAANYARFRPAYPLELFEWIAYAAPAHDAVWDCACGNGQASIPLAEFFDRVEATDFSAQQIAEAPLHPRVAYHVAAAEQSGLDAGSVDAITVAQALHWFDLDRFYSEVRRVARPRGLVVAWSYGVLATGDVEVDTIFQSFHDVTVGPYWPPRRSSVDLRYDDIPWPFAPVAPPPVKLRLQWTVEQLLGYVGTWSATQRYIAVNCDDPVPAFAEQLQRAWGSITRTVEWPMTILAGRA